MSKTEAKVTRGEQVAALVLDVQARRAQGHDDRVPAGALLRLVDPMIRAVARLFTASARGSLGLDDLAQIGAMQCLRFVDRFEVGRGAATFEVMLAREVKSACYEQIRLHGLAVRVQHKRGSSKSFAAVVEQKTLEKNLRLRIDSIDSALDVAGEETPESLLEREQSMAALRRGLSGLAPARRALVHRSFGFNGSPQKLQSLVAEGLAGSRATACRQIRASVEQLRAAVA